MFKSGEIAGVVAEPHRRVEIFGSGAAKRIQTIEGEFEEAELFVAHPTVLQTASGQPDPSLAKSWHREKSPEDLPYEMCHQIGEALKGLPFDWNGHWKNGAKVSKEYRKQPLQRAFIGDKAMYRADAEDFLRAVRTKKALSRWVPVSVSEFRLAFRACPCCGVQHDGVETNGKKVRVLGDRCPFAKGLPPTEWELNVPSGKLVVANDLRRLFPVDEEFDINTTIGCRNTALTYAANGLSHAFVSNTCPTVYRCADKSYKIATAPSDERWNGERYVKVKTPKFDGKRVAGICTDLWWYSICDHDEFLRRCEHFKCKPEDFKIDIVKVKPGVYRFQHNEDAARHDGDKECVFTRFERIRKADPVKDFLAAHTAIETHAHAWVQAQTQTWPTLYGKVVEKPGREETVPWSDLTEEERYCSWQRVADHTFCTIGGGIKWHEKGFPQGKVDPTVPDMEPPSFRKQCHWYPFSSPYGGLFKPKVLAPSFAKLAFRILESVISFGMTVHDNNHSREVPYVRERMLVAVKRYRQLAKQYPDLADPEYVAWLKQKGRAEAWVERFDLGPTFTEKHAKHAKSQRWVPEDAYAVEFDARNLADGHFAWHPKNGGCWASKKNAQRYAILEWKDNGQAPTHNCFWAPHAITTSVPLYIVARVLKIGTISHMGETVIEVAFDYGTPWMKGDSRKALREVADKAGIRVLTKEEYEAALPKAEAFFVDAEAAVT